MFVNIYLNGITWSNFIFKQYLLEYEISRQIIPFTYNNCNSIIHLISSGILNRSKFVSKVKTYYKLLKNIIYA